MNTQCEQEEFILRIHHLGSWNPAQRKQAEQQLQQMGPDAIAPLLAVLEQERGKRAQRMRLSNWVAGVGILAVLLVGIAWMIASLLGRHWKNVPPLVMQDVYFGTMGLVGILAKPTLLQKRAA